MDRPPDQGFYWQEGARHAHDSWWGGPFHAIVFILLLILVVGGVVWLVRRLAPAAMTQPAVTGAADPAVTALRLRYAKGEVSRDDFRAAIEDLTGAVDANVGATPGAEPPPPTT
jgi:uncharacterized membrane protein